MLCPHSLITSCVAACKTTIHAVLSKNILHDTFSGRRLLLESLCAPSIQWSFTSCWKLMCLVFIFTNSKTIAVPVCFSTSSWQG